MYGAVDFTTILLPRGLPGFIYQWFQRFNHVNLTTCGGAAGAGRSQLPLCGPVRRLRENQWETNLAKSKEAECSAFVVQRHGLEKIGWLLLSHRSFPEMSGITVNVEKT